MGLPPVVTVFLSATLELYACSRVVRHLHSSGCNLRTLTFRAVARLRNQFVTDAGRTQQSRVPAPRSIVRSVDRGIVARKAADCKRSYFGVRLTNGTDRSEAAERTESRAAYQSQTHSNTCRKWLQRSRTVTRRALYCTHPFLIYK